MDRMVAALYKNILVRGERVIGWKEHCGRRIIKLRHSYVNDDVIVIDTHKAEIKQGTTGDLVLYDYEVAKEAEQGSMDMLANLLGI